MYLKNIRESFATDMQAFFDDGQNWANKTPKTFADVRSIGAAHNCLHGSGLFRKYFVGDDKVNDNHIDTLLRSIFPNMPKA